MRLDFSILGVDKAVAKLKILEKDVRKDSEKAMYRAATIVERRAHENISGMHGHKRHVKTGNLRRNIKSKSKWTGSYDIDGIIGTDVPYAPYVEALPDGGFLYPALREVGKEALEYFHNQLVKIIKDAI